MNSKFNDKFLCVVNEFPQKIAIRDQETSINYKELLESSLQYRDFLFFNKIENSCIAISIENRIEHICAIIGILLSGNYYYSLEEVTYENCELIKNYLKSPCILTCNRNINSDFFACNEQKVFIDNLSKIKDYDDLYISGENFCAFATSGSTGVPKILIHSQKFIMADTLRQISDNKIMDNDKIDLLFSLSFTASLACIFPAILSGAELNIFDLKRSGIENLYSFWKHNKITFTTLSTSSFRTICRIFPSFKELNDLRIISIGAETVLKDDIEVFQRNFPDNCILQVSYATTETRTISEYKIGTKNKSASFISSVGKAVEGRIIRILDENKNECLAGETGEIIVIAEYLPEQYINKSDKSLQAFSKSENNKITYFTNDTGYFDKDGYLYLTGRKDNIIKINGFKTNLSEIEKAILSDKNVLETNVVFIDNFNYKKLKAFIKVKEDFVLDNLKNTLYKKLPLIMIPDSYIILDNFPKTRTGKVDKNKLIDIEDSVLRENIIDENYSYELNLIIEILKKELNHNYISVYADFFIDLGLDSLSSAIVINCIEKELKIKFPTNITYFARTPKTLSEFIRIFKKEKNNYLVKLNFHLKEKDNIYLFPGILLNLSHYLGLYNHLSNTFNIYFVYYSVTDDLGNFISSEKLVEQIYNNISKTIYSGNKNIFIGYSFGGLIAYLLACRMNIESLILIDSIYYSRKNLLRSSLRKYHKKVKEKIKKISYHNLKEKITRKRNTFNKEHNKGLNKELYINNAYIYYSKKNLLNQKYAGNCLFIKAEKNISFKINVGDWEKNIQKEFKLININSSHSEIVNKENSRIISDSIIDFIF